MTWQCEFAFVPRIGPILRATMPAWECARTDWEGTPCGALNFDNSPCDMCGEPFDAKYALYTKRARKSVTYTEQSSDEEDEDEDDEDDENEDDDSEDDENEDGVGGGPSDSKRQKTSEADAGQYDEAAAEAACAARLRALRWVQALADLVDRKCVRETARALLELPLPQQDALLANKDSLRDKVEELRKEVLYESDSQSTASAGESTASEQKEITVQALLQVHEPEKKRRLYRMDEWLLRQQQLPQQQQQPAAALQQPPATSQADNVKLRDTWAKDSILEKIKNS